MRLKFLEEGTKFSMRKLWAFSSLIVFIVSCFYYLIKHEGDLSSSHYWLLGLIVAFYFARGSLQNLSIGDKNNVQKS